MNKNFIIITGGTGGHVIPSVNLANFLLKNNYNCFIITDRRGKKYISNFKGKIYEISASHLSGNLIFNIIGLVKLLIGFFQSLFIFIKIRPQLVISFGSYASLAPSLTAIILKYLFKIKFFIHEQNSVIGRSNKFFIKFATKVFVNFDKDYNFTNKILKKVYVVGLPKKTNYFNNNKRNYIVNNKFILFIYGGSQGSIPLIKFIEKLILKLDTNIIKDIFFVVQCPKYYKNNIAEKLDSNYCKYNINEFYDDINEILSKSNMIISRAGAGTIDDIIKYKVPSILMPLSKSKDDHQYENAKILSDYDCALIINQKNEDILKAKEFLIEILQNKEKIKKIKKNFDNIKYLDTNNIILNLIKND